MLMEREKRNQPKKKKEDAVKVLRQFQSSFDMYIEKGIISLLVFCDEYIIYIQLSKSQSYAKSIQYYFSQLLQFVGNIPIQKITTKILDQFVTFIYARSKSASGLYYRNLKAAFSKAIVWEYISENPLNKTKVPKCYPVYISESELILILHNTTTQLCKDIFTTDFYSGMRLGELVKMKWYWIDLKNKFIIVKNSKSFNTKNKRERIIPIHPKINIILKRCLNKQQQKQYVFYRYEGIK